MDFFDKELFEKDLRSIALWLNVESIEHIDITLSKMSLSNFANQITEMEKSYPEFPKEKERTQRIYNKLKKGEAPLPIFIQNGDENNFIMEGRHRIVAFKWLGLEEVIVAKVQEKTLELKVKLKPF
jgi:hypothetical protein